jgi:chromosome segregation ATPase
MHTFDLNHVAAYLFALLSLLTIAGCANEPSTYDPARATTFDILFHKDKFDARHQSMAEEVALLNYQNSKLQQQLLERQKELERLQVEQSVAREKIAKTDAERQELEDDTAQLQTRLQHALAQNAKIENALSVSKKRIDAGGGTDPEMVKKIKTQEAELARLNTEVEFLDATIRRKLSEHIRARSGGS